MFSAYRAQPLIEAYLGHPFSLDTGFLGLVGADDDPSEHPVIGYAGTRAEYIREHTWTRPATTDVLTLNGWCLEVYEHGMQAVHAVCDPALCPRDAPRPAVWPDSEAYLADLPGDTILVRVHCHC